MNSPRKVIPLHGDCTARPYHSPAVNQPSHDLSRKLRASLSKEPDLTPAEKLHALVDSLEEEDQFCLLLTAQALVIKLEACNQKRNAR